MSAARLAAEAAFGQPSIRPPAPSAAQVIVRRARLGVGLGAGLGVGAAAAAQPATADAAGASLLPLDKSPRVFRVGPVQAVAHTTTQHDARPDGAAEQGPSPVQARPGRRRVSNDKRPGPVLHVVHAVPEPQRSAASMAVTLAAELARLAPLLASIERLQSLQFIDDRRAVEWQQLSQRAQALRSELRSQVRWIDLQAADSAR